MSHRSMARLSPLSKRRKSDPPDKTSRAHRVTPVSGCLQRSRLLQMWPKRSLVTIVDLAVSTASPSWPPSSGIGPFPIQLCGTLLEHNFLTEKTAASHTTRQHLSSMSITHTIVVYYLIYNIRTQTRIRISIRHT